MAYLVRMSRCSQILDTVSFTQLFMYIERASPYLTNSFNIPGQDGPQVDELTRHTQFFLRHIGHLPHDMDLERKTFKQIIII